MHGKHGKDTNRTAKAGRIGQWATRPVTLTASLLKRLRNGRFTSETAVRRFQKRNGHLDPGAVYNKKSFGVSRKLYWLYIYICSTRVFQYGCDGHGYRYTFGVKCLGGRSWIWVTEMYVQCRAILIWGQHGAAAVQCYSTIAPV